VLFHVAEPHIFNVQPRLLGKSTPIANNMLPERVQKPL